VQQEQVLTLGASILRQQQPEPIISAIVARRMPDQPWRVFIVALLEKLSVGELLLTIVG
jgi:hypothetical protein